MSGRIDTPGMSRDIPVALIAPDPEQPRKHFDAAALSDLALSMTESGLAAPILVRPDGERFVIVHGERRWRAAKQIGWETIPANVRDIDRDTGQWLSLIENVQRSDLTPTEEAAAFQRRLNSGMSQTVLGKRIGKSQSYIAHKVRLLTLPAPLLSYLEVGALSEGHLRELLRLRAYYGDGPQQSFERQFGLVRVKDGKGPGLGEVAKVEVDDFETLSWDLASATFEERDQLRAISLRIRPEDNPRLWLFLSSTPIEPLVPPAFRTFARWVAENEYIVPSWVPCAFWWATAGVHTQMSVSRLSKAIDLWRERMLHAMIGLLIYKDSPKTEADAMEYFGWRADLRHAGLHDINGLPEGMFDEALESLVAREAFVLPSSLQPWGFGFERYRALLGEDGSPQVEVSA